MEEIWFYLRIIKNGFCDKEIAWTGPFKSFEEANKSRKEYVDTYENEEMASPVMKGYIEDRLNTIKTKN